MRLLVTISFVFLMEFGFSQKAINSKWWLNSQHKSFVMINTGINATSADFSNRFASELVFSDQLNTETIDQELKGLNKTENIIGLDYELALHGGWSIGNGAHSVLFKMADVAHLNATIPKHFTRLIFKGNKSFAGDTLDFSSLNTMGVRYQQMAIGWHYQPTPNSGFFALLSYINGEQFVDANLNRSWLYTSALGDTLSTIVNGSFAISDTARSGFGTNNGSGAAIDFGFHMQFGGEESDWDFDFAINNLGMIRWDGQTINADIDTNYLWRGIQVVDITNLNGQFAENELADSLSDGVMSNLVKQNRIMWLPGAIHAELLQRRDIGIETGGGWVYRWNANFDPFVYLKSGYRFSDHVATHLSVGYGGYGTFQAGLSSAFEWTHFAASIELRNIEAILLPGRFAGGGALLNVRYLF